MTLFTLNIIAKRNIFYLQKEIYNIHKIKMNENIYLIRPLANKVKDKYIYIYIYIIIIFLTLVFSFNSNTIYIILFLTFVIYERKGLNIIVVLGLYTIKNKIETHTLTIIFFSGST
jgi:hypothetical protein